MSRSRPGLIALVAVAVELVVVAVLGSPAVSDSLHRRASDASTTTQDVLIALTTLSWYAGGDDVSTGAFVGAFVAIAVLLVLTCLLVWVLTRGYPSAVQVWLATWPAVLGATVVAVIVRAAFTTPGGARATVDRALFASVTGGTVLYGLALGLLVALVGAVVHVVTRRALEPGSEQKAVEVEVQQVPAAAAQYGYRPSSVQRPESDQPTQWLPPATQQPSGGTAPLPVLPAEQPAQGQPTTQVPSSAPVWAAQTSEFGPVAQDEDDNPRQR